MTTDTVREKSLNGASPGKGALLWARRVSRWALVGFVVLDPISISLSQFCVAVGVLAGATAWAFNRRAGRAQDEFPLWIPIVSFTILTLLSALFSNDVPRSLLDSKQLLQFFILYWTLGAVPDTPWARRLLHLFILVAAVLSLVGIGQFFLSEGPVLTRRPYGMLSHFQTFAGVLLLGTLPAVSLATAKSVPRSERIFGVLTSLVLIFGLLVSLTRGAWIGLFVGVAVLLVIQGRAKWLLFLPMIVVGLYIVGPTDFKQRLLNTVRFDENASGERLRMWKAGYRIIGSHPVFGVGINMIRREYPQFRVEGATRLWTGHLHSNLIHLGAERGLPALAAWIWIWAAFFYRGAKALRQRLAGGEWTPPAEMASAGLAAVAGFLTAGLFEYNFGDSEVVMVVYWMMAFPFITGRGIRRA